MHETILQSLVGFFMVCDWLEAIPTVWAIKIAAPRFKIEQSTGKKRLY